MVDAKEPEGTGASEDTESEPRPAAGLIAGLRGLDRAQIAFGALLIAVVGIAAFTNVLGLPFHLGDRSFLVENDALHRVETSAQVWDSGRLRPVAALSLALNWSLSDPSAGAFHVTNVLLHLLNGIIVFLICCRVLGKEVPAAISMVAGMMFVAHPALTHTVNHIPARSVLLGTTFVLLCVFFFLRGIQKEGKLGYGAVALSLVCFAFAWGTDAAAWIVPFLLVLAAVASRRRESLRERAALFASYVLLLVGLLIASASVEAGVSRSGDGPLSAFTQARALGSFLPPTFLPIGLQVEHAPYQSELQGLPWLWALLVVGAGVLMRFARVPGMALLWYLFAVLASGVFAVDASFREERLYLPLAGLVLILPWGLSKLPKPALRTMGGVVCALLLLGCVAMTSTRNNLWRSEGDLWRQANASCPDCYRPKARLAQLHLTQGEQGLRSIARGEAGLDAESARKDAEAHFSFARSFSEEATQSGRADARVWDGYARTLMHFGDPQAAAEALKNALRLDHDFQDSLLLMAAIYSERANASGGSADLERALRYLRRADEVSELSPDALAHYAALSVRHGDLREGSLALSRLQQIDPGLLPARAMDELTVKGQVFRNLQATTNSRREQGAGDPEMMGLRAQQLHLEGRYVMSSYMAREAIRNSVPPRELWTLLGINSAKTASLDQFISDWPTGPEAEFDIGPWRSLAGACASSGEWAAALNVLTHLRAESKDVTSADVMLASLALELGEPQRAAAYYQQALAGNPEDLAALLGMADLLLDQGQVDGARQFISLAESKGAPESALKERKERAGMGVTDSSGLRRTIIR